MTQPTANAMMQAYAEDAVDFALARFQVSLDYTEDSLSLTEQILSQLHDTLPKSAIARLLKRGPSQDQIWQMSKMWGGYVGEVMRRRWGGQWSTESRAHSEPTITLQIGASEVYPPAKVYKRLNNGQEDNILHYYQVLKNDYEQKGTNGE